MTSSFDSHSEALRKQINSYLTADIPAGPRELYDPVRSTIEAGGKRVRPILTALCYHLEATGDAWLPAASAVELLHTFTLVHDDIMDNATSRRGRPTTHVAYGVNGAILSGDVLIALAMEQIAKLDTPNVRKMIEEFAYAFRMVCEGQALDKKFEMRDDITVAEYLHMIDLKTSKVLELAAVLGGLAGGGHFVEELRTFAHHLGLAFQISDDLLDLTADEASFGKAIGGDITEGKRTLLFVAATEHYAELDGASTELLDRIRDRRATPADIPHARQLFENLGVLKTAERMAREQTEKARGVLTRIPSSEAREQLNAFSDYLLMRKG